MPFTYNNQSDFSNDRYKPIHKKHIHRTKAPISRIPSHIRDYTLFFVIGTLVLSSIFVGYAVLLPHNVTVSINGVEQNVPVGATIEKLIHDGYAHPKPGDMIAVDGTIAKADGGDMFEAKIDGKKVDSDAAITMKTKTVSIKDGSDINEPCTEKTVTIKPDTSAASEPTMRSYYTAPIHLYRKPANGKKVIKKGKVSGKTVETITKHPVTGGFDAVHADTKGEKIIALTFDDGPWAGSTSQILDILKANDAHATFFQVGKQVPALADIEKRIVAEGNQVATHTYDHAAGSGQGVNLTYMTKDEQRSEVTRGFDAIESTLGKKIHHIMRAPGGNYYGSLPANLSDIADVEIGWSIDTEDWRRPGASAIEQQILKAQPGSVILMHDGGGNRSQTVEALRNALPKLAARGYKFVTIDELLKYCK